MKIGEKSVLILRPVFKTILNDFLTNYKIFYLFFLLLGLHSSCGTLLSCNVQTAEYSVFYDTKCM